MSVLGVKDIASFFGGLSRPFALMRSLGSLLQIQPRDVSISKPGYCLISTQCVACAELGENSQKKIIFLIIVKFGEKIGVGDCFQIIAKHCLRGYAGSRSLQYGLLVSPACYQ